MNWRLATLGVLSDLPVAIWPYFTSEWWSGTASFLLGLLIIVALGSVVSSLMFRGRVSRRTTVVFCTVSFLLGVANSFSFLKADSIYRHAVFDCNAARLGAQGTDLQNCVIAPELRLVTMMVLLGFSVPSLLLLGSLVLYSTLEPYNLYQLKKYCHD